MLTLNIFGNVELKKRALLQVLLCLNKYQCSDFKCVAKNHPVLVKVISVVVFLINKLFHKKKLINEKN